MKRFLMYLATLFLVILFANCNMAKDGEAAPETDPSITVSTLVSNFPGNDGLSIDSKGNIYVNSNGSNGVLNGKSVHKVTPEGNVSLFADNLPNWPVASMIKDDQLYITGWLEGKVVSLNVEGGAPDILVTGINGAGSLDIDQADNMYVVEFNTNSVLKIPSGGKKAVFSTGFPIQRPAGLTINPEDKSVYVSNWVNGTICQISPNGETEKFVTLPVNNVGPIRYFDGVIYATSPKTHQIFKVDVATKKVALFAGTGAQGHTDGGIQEATFDTPTGIATLDGITFYVSEANAGQGRLRKITVKQ